MLTGSGDYRSIADAIEADIGAGHLKPGQRLQPQREFAYSRKIAPSTAARTYRELVRRGLVIGEVGRGTFVRMHGQPPERTLIDPRSGLIDLELVSPVLDVHRRLFAKSLQRLSAAALTGDLLRTVGAVPTEDLAELGTRFVATEDWVPDPRQILFTGSGKQALAAVIRTLVEPGGRLGVEAMTYPVVKNIARQLQVELIPLEMDAEGLQPNALEHALSKGQIAAVYVQPSVQNPMGCTMGIPRRREIAAVLRKWNAVAIEDGIYRFLVDEPPLVTFAPQCVVLIDSLSKRLAPGLALGIVAAPLFHVSALTMAIRGSAYMPTGLGLAMGALWMESPDMPGVVLDKRVDATKRQTMARELLAGTPVVGDPRAYHLWLELPDTWRAEQFCMEASRQGIALAAGSAFSATPGHAPNGVRLALAAPSHDQLKMALERVSALAITPGPVDIE